MTIHDDDDESNNCLGFSIAPHHHHHHFNMGHLIPPTPTTHDHHHSASASASASTAAMPSSFFNLTSYPSSSPSSYYLQSHNGVASLFSSPSPSHPMFPLQSDASLSIMEPLTQAMVTTTAAASSSQTPKLEDFFATHHHYQTNERETMALSLPNNTSNNNLTYHLHQLQQQFYHSSSFRGYHDMFNHNEDESPEDVQAAQQQQIHDNAGESATGSTGSMSAAYGDLQSLSLSMSPASQSSCGVTVSQISTPLAECGVVMAENKKRGSDKLDHKKQIVHRKSIDTFGQRTSQYRGVTRHRWTGRYEAHLWDNSCKKEGQSRKGRQVYLGGYDMEEKAARSYDLASLKYWGASTHINFPLEKYHKELEEMKNMTRQEYVAHLRRKSSGFSRGASMYRGVTRHHQHGRWQARIGRVAGNKDLYLGTFSTQEEAAEAYDVAAIKFRGMNAVTNFDITRYDVERIMASNTLLSGESARRIKDTLAATTMNNNSSYNAAEALVLPYSHDHSEPSELKMVVYHQHQNKSSDHCNQSFPSMGQEESLIDINNISVVHNQHQEVEESSKIQVSNASSLETSLNSSREVSPHPSGAADHRGANSLPMLFRMGPTTTSSSAAASAKLLIGGGSSDHSSSNSANTSSSWIASAPQLRPAAVPLPQMPVFAAWTDG
ncbi:AP2-like ethylene-responsive transcription factor ANT [Linum perenne]